MGNSNHLRIVFYLVALAIGIGFAYFGGLFEKQLDILGSGNIMKVTPIQEGDNVTKLDQDSERIGISCQVISSKDNTICGGTFWTHDNMGHGWNLNGFDYLELGITTKSENVSDNVKLTFKNYNDKYSLPDDVISQKYNSVMLSLNNAKPLYDIPLDYFQVETWWMHRYNVQYEDAQTELTNVHSFEIVYNNIDEAGLYELNIYKIRLKGQWLSLVEVMGLIMAILLIAIVILLDRQREQQRQISFVDPLTRLTNRRGLESWIDDLACSEKTLKKASLLFMDIDDFKHINDTHGHSTGDELLKSFCGIVNQSITQLGANNKHLHFTRLSGDEFAVILIHQDSERAKQLAEAIIDKLKAPILLNELSIEASVSMGISSDILGSSNTRRLFSNADAAMYYAKRRGKNQYKEFDIDVEAEQVGRKRIADELKLEIEQDKLALKFLPIYNTKNKQVESVEVVFSSQSALLNQLDRGGICALAHEFGMIEKLDAWTINAAFKLLDRKRDIVESLKLAFNINVTSGELKDNHFVDKIKTLLHEHHIPSKWINLEITESLMIDNRGVNQDCLEAIRNTGINLILDEFGVGATALSQIVHYPIDALKIHSTFIQELSSHNDKSQLMVQSIISIARTCGVKTIAEGVNNLEQFYCLQNMGCDMIQGHIFCDPLNFEELVAGLKNQTIFGGKPAQQLESQDGEIEHANNQHHLSTCTK